ncbi:hypothetical protein Goari_011981 [Gossypium aridum]|uniref:Uncharacterized protein n=1 Tax=Gossypium aridum TaxID=34290 RepID=A0A7J8WZ65_GOSAI|nr:hypothetical protein [Gossypium aridum]
MIYGQQFLIDNLVEHEKDDCKGKRESECIEKKQNRFKIRNSRKCSAARSSWMLPPSKTKDASDRSETCTPSRVYSDQIKEEVIFLDDITGTGPGIRCYNVGLQLSLPIDGEVIMEAVHRCDYLPTCEPFLTPELVTSPDFMDGFRYKGKSYLLSDAEKSRQCRHKRPRREPSNPSYPLVVLQTHLASSFNLGESSEQQPQWGMYNGLLEPKHTQPWKKEIKIEINIEVEEKIKIKNMRS